MSKLKINSSYYIIYMRLDFLEIRNIITAIFYETQQKHFTEKRIGRIYQQIEAIKKILYSDDVQSPRTFKPDARAYFVDATYEAFTARTTAFMRFLEAWIRDVALSS